MRRTRGRTRTRKKDVRSGVGDSRAGWGKQYRAMSWGEAATGAVVVAGGCCPRTAKEAQQPSEEEKARYDLVVRERPSALHRLSSCVRFLCLSVP